MIKEISSILDLIQKNNLDKAFQLANSLYTKNDKDFNLIKVLAYIYMQKNNFTKSEDLLKSGLEINPSLKDFDYFNNLGYSLLRIEEYEEALIYLNKALEVNQDTPAIWTNFAEVHLALRNFQIAKDNIDIAISKIDLKNTNKISEQTNVFWMLSSINTSLKKDKESADFFKEILKENFNENIFYLLSTIDSDSISSEILDIALSKAQTNNEKFQNKLKRFYFVTPLYFGLANCYQKKNKLESEKFYHFGNQEIFNTTRYNSFSYQKKISSTIDHFAHLEHFENKDRDLGKENIFIVGSPRSGTTLLESLITANDEVFSGGELSSAKNILSKNISINNLDLTNFYNDFTSKYLSRTKFIKATHSKIVDKLPENFLYIGYILKFLPGSKILRIFRHPWDTAISLYKQRYVQNIPYSASFFNIGVFLANFEGINLYWNKVLKDSELSKSIMDIYYEDLVADQNTNQKEIYNFLKLQSVYNDRKREEFFSTTASMRQVRNQIHQKSINKKEFEDNKSEFVEAFLMQRKYWKSKNLWSKDERFFGYDLY